jgi:pimeloyl-ACP methyl ester carboxylesterase
VPAPVSVPALGESFYHHEGVKIRYKDIGRGTPVVFIHGFGTSLDTWRYLADGLKANHRLVFLDLKGHGFSDRTPDDKYALQDHAEIVLGLIRHLNLTDVVIVGHSYGAVVAVGAALQASERPSPNITGLVMIDGALEPEHVPVFLKLLRAPLLGWLTVKLTTASFRTRLMLLRAFHDDSKVTDELVELYAGYQMMPGAEHAMIATARQIIPENLPRVREKLAALSIRVLNIWGEHDVVVKRAGAESVCKILPRCRLVVVADAGHVPQEETPATVIPLLQEFLDPPTGGTFDTALPRSSLGGAARNQRGSGERYFVRAERERGNDQESADHQDNPGGRRSALP